VAHNESSSDLAGAQGKLVMFLASLLQRAGIVETAEFGALLLVFADSVRETDPGQGDILAEWASALNGLTSG
jgi:hypothetical protein